MNADHRRTNRLLGAIALFVILGVAEEFATGVLIGMGTYSDDAVVGAGIGAGILALVVLFVLWSDHSHARPQAPGRQRDDYDLEVRRMRDDNVDIARIAYDTGTTRQQVERAIERNLVADRNAAALERTRAARQTP